MKPPVKNTTAGRLNWRTGELLSLRLLIGGVLAYAGFMKAVAPAAEFAAVIQTYHLIPPVWAMPMANALPWIEMWVGTFLIFGYATPLSAAGAAALFAGFFAALSSVILRRLDLASCGCFGPESLSPKHSLVIDGVLLLLTLLLIPLSRKVRFYSLDSWLDR